MTIIKKYNTDNFLLSADKLIMYGHQTVIADRSFSALIDVKSDIWFGLIFSDNFLFQSENGGDIEVVNLSNLSNRKLGIKGFLFKNVITENQLYFAGTENNIVELDKNLSAFDSKLTGRIPRIIIDTFAIQVSNNKLIVRDFSKQQELWQISLMELLGTENAQVVGPVIHFDGRLFVCLSDMHQVYSTFVISIKTGDVLMRIEEFGGSFVLYDKKIYSVGWNSVQVLDPVSYKTEKIDFTKQLKHEGILMEWSNFIIDGSYIYFADANRPIVGVLDLEIEEMIWHTEIEVYHQEVKKITKMQVNDGRLYVQSSDSILYVFEHHI